MKLNNNLIIGAALLGGGAYYAYTKGLFGKKKGETPDQAIKDSQATLDKIAAEQKALSNAQKITTATKAIVTAADSITNINSYKGKVAYIQSSLGVSVDGNAGSSANSQTNKAFNSIYGLDKGVISPANIDYYKKRVEIKDTLSARKVAAANKAKNVAQVGGDAAKFLTLVNSGKYKGTLTKDVIANAFTYDVAKKVYVDLKEPRKFTKGSTVSYGQFSKLPRAGYVMFFSGGIPSSTKLYAFNPNDFLVTL